MMKKLLVIGIGAGNPDYITMQAVKALNQVDVFFLMDKGQSKDKLIDLRREICDRYITDRTYRFVEAHSPERERGDVDYKTSVEDLNLAKQMTFERLINEEMTDEPVRRFSGVGRPGVVRQHHSDPAGDSGLGALRVRVRSDPRHHQRPGAGGSAQGAVESHRPLD